MAVRLFLSSGAERTIDAADSARLDVPFFIISRWDRWTVLTLRSEIVVAAEVIRDGVVTEYVHGAPSQGNPQKEP